MKKVLVAGATGYLGRFMVLECNKQGYFVRVLTRNAKKLDDLKEHIDDVVESEITNPDSLAGICQGIDIVISSIGITRQKENLTYMDVDYQANSNLLKEARMSGSKKFIYVSVFNAHLMTDLKIIQAKERFAEELRSSGIDYTIIRPNGFFSDMVELMNMAKKGTIYLFGNGKYESNPIHGADLAEFIVQKLNSRETNLEIGGPDLLTQNQIARMAFSVAGIREKIVYIPLWIKNIALKLTRWFSGQKSYGPIEFFMTVMTMDMIAPQFGTHHLSDFYREINDSL
jgi:uncharacterized protein YbjT (DUF2867 family)